MNITGLLNDWYSLFIKEINKGWSADKKYYIKRNDGSDFLLRISSIEQYDQKLLEFNYVREICLKGLPTSKPLDIKEVNNEVYSLFTWMEGRDINDVLPLLEDEVQFQLGAESGKILKQIHELKTPEKIEKWENSFQRKTNRNILRYRSCPLKYEKEELFMRYIEENRHLIESRPSTFQHGDFHTGNMILSSENELSIIDFNRWGYGDPWEEFNRIDFTAEMSPLFATGQLNAYFKGRPPVGFLKLLLLYISVNALNALPWALNYSDKEVVTMKKKAATVLDWYDDMKAIMPSWYNEEAVLKYGL